MSAPVEYRLSDLAPEPPIHSVVEELERADDAHPRRWVRVVGENDDRWLSIGSVVTTAWTWIDLVLHGVRLVPDACRICLDHPDPTDREWMVAAGPGAQIHIYPADGGHIAPSDTAYARQLLTAVPSEAEVTAWVAEHVRQTWELGQAIELAISAMTLLDDQAAIYRARRRLESAFAPCREWLS